MSENFKLAGIEIKTYFIVAVVLAIGIFAGVLPAGMVGAFPVLMVLGAFLEWIGTKTPIIKDYLGGGPIVIIFVSAAIVYFGILPEKSVDSLKNFMTKEAFLDFYIAALITGSILGMNRKLLIKSAVRYLPVILGGVIVALLLTGAIGSILGYGFKKAVFFVAIPIMGGGVGAGAVPLAQIFGKAMNQDPKSILSVMIPAVALGNALTIVAGGLFNRLGKKYTKLTGNGNLLKKFEQPAVEKVAEEKMNFENLAVGIILSTTFFVFGNVLGKFIKIHPYALMIISVAIFKATGIMKLEYEKCAEQWFKFVMKVFTPALLVGIGIAYTSLKEVISAFNLTYLILVLTTVVGAIIGTAVVGHLFGFFVIEATITAGLCMANMGGTGDVAVLSSAHRMELMPFAQISSRIGGAFMLILTSILINIFM
ncbi:MAG: 2-hydroxycarboxylate transporter family protein [Fusobacteriaceae bacterium]